MSETETEKQTGGENVEAYGEILAWWKQKNIQTEAELAEALHSVGVLFAFHSGKQENERVTWHDTREIFSHDGVTDYSGDLLTLLEIRNAKIAYTFFLSAFGEHRALDEAFLLRLHKLLTRNTYDARRYEIGERPGTFKRHGFVTGRYEVGAPPEDTAEETRELLSELRDLPLPEEKLLTAGAYFHARLENIRPFADGNGTTGRLALNYFLVSHNHPPVVIHEEDRAAYLGALESWDAVQDLRPMRTFLEEQLVKTWSRRRKPAESKEAASAPKLHDFL